MFTEQHRQLILDALDATVASNNRTLSKKPKFRPIIETELAQIREAQAAVRAWATQDAKDRK